MITVLLRGGLGNQMFQYAFGLQLAKKYKTELLLDTVLLNDRFPRKDFTYRTFDLDVFTLEPRFTKLSEISHRLPVPGAWLVADFSYMKMRTFLGLQKWINQGDVLDPNILQSDGNAFLFGYWQSEKYFEAIGDEVIKAFQFRDPLAGEAAQLAQLIRSCNSVAVCVRRGDYITSPSARAMMGETNVDYYAQARAYIGEYVKSPRYFVFTDDVEWCRANLDFPATTVFIGKLGPKWSFHLQLVSLCKHNIIANSTFYWWGAWLNANPTKIVIAPKRWFASLPKGIDDLVPERWIKM
jgi:hypothetical protein